jgi:hypothetical protein
MIPQRVLTMRTGTTSIRAKSQPDTEPKGDLSPPRTLTAIIDGRGRHDATVTALAQAVPYRWDGTPANRLSEQLSDGGRRSDHLQAHNRLVAGLSPTSPTTQSCAVPMSWSRPNCL